MDNIIYTILRKAHRKTASIVVQPDKTVKIIAPAIYSDEQISELAASKRKWIQRKLKELDTCELPTPRHHYTDGDRFLFLGNELSLKVLSGKGDIVVEHDTIIATVPVGLSQLESSEYIKGELHSWYVAQAQQILKKKTYEFGEIIGIQPVFVSTKEYKSRWGCCFSDGRIYYNWKIILAPEHIIDYVVVHELFHFMEPNHSATYWQHVEKVIPDWKERRKWLRLNGHALEI